MPAFERRRWSLASGAAHALAILREGGPYALFDRGLSRLGVHRLLVLAQPLAGGVSAAPAVAARALPALTLGEAREADLDALAELRAAEHEEVNAALGRPREPVQALLGRLFASGDRCFVARSGSRIVAVLWVTHGEVSVRYLLCDLLLEPGDAYVYDVFVTPELRGRGLATALYHHLASVLVAEGRTRAVMLVRPHNTANLRAAARAGYMRVGMLSCVAAPGRVLHFGRALSTRAWPED